MSRSKGATNLITREAREQLAEILEARGDDLRTWGLDIIFKGKISGVRGKIDPQLRIAVWREMMSFAFAKQATIKHEVDGADTQISFSWEQDDDIIEGEIGIVN